MTHANDYGDLVPDVDETFAFIGGVLVVASALLLGTLAGAVVAAWLVLR